MVGGGDTKPSGLEPATSRPWMGCLPQVQVEIAQSLVHASNVIPVDIVADGFEQFVGVTVPACGSADVVRLVLT